MPSRSRKRRILTNKRQTKSFCFKIQKKKWDGRTDGCLGNNYNQETRSNYSGNTTTKTTSMLMAKKNATQPRRVIPIVIIIIFMGREREIIIIHLAINIDIRRQSISRSSCCGPSSVGRPVVRSSITSHWPQKFPLESPCLFSAKQFLLSIPVQVTSNSCPFNHKVNGIETHTHTQTPVHQKLLEKHEIEANNRR